MDPTMSVYDDNLTRLDLPSSFHHIKFLEGIATLLSQWHALQLAVENHWGGKDSTEKYQKLVIDIFSWFTFRTRASLCVDELDSLLHENMLLCFNTEIEDGSIEEVVEQLMILHEEYVQTTRSIECST